MHQYLKTLHNWMGITVGLLFGLLTATGVLLVFEPELEPIASPDLRIDYTGPLSADDAGRIVEGITTRHAALQPRIIEFSNSVKAYIIAWLGDGTMLYLDPQSLDILEHVKRGRTLFTFLRELHVNLLLPKYGHTVVGVIGMAVFVLALTGAILWLRHRRQFTLRNMIPRAATGSGLLRSHHTSGIVIVAVLLASVITGTVLAFLEPVQQFAGLIDGHSLDYSRPKTEQSGDGDALPWPVLTRAAARALPKGEFRSVALPRSGKPLAVFRLHLRKDWNPGGLSAVYVNSQTGEVLKVVRADQAGPVTRLINTIYALHSGYSLPLAYRLVVLASGLAGFWLVFLGVTAYVVRRRSKRPVY